MQNIVTGDCYRFRENGLEGSNLNSVGVSGTRVGSPFLRATPSSWDERRLSARAEGAIEMDRVPLRCSMWDVSK